jgi:AraC-like DNA-binding protein
MAQEHPSDFRREFFSRLPHIEAIMRLFESLPHTYFYAKDSQSRFVKVNHLFLENHGLSSESEAIGKSDRDFHPPAMAEAYIAEDRRVMESRTMLTGQLWPVLHRRQAFRWYVSTKTPLFDANDQVVGLAGAMYQVDQPEEMAKHLQEMLPVTRYVEEHYTETISMAHLARISGMSSTHFNRRFQQLLRMTPTQYVRTLRIQVARQLLTTTTRTLTDIATSIGFTDQSHFTKRFRETTGLTPDAYRQRFVARS